MEFGLLDTFELLGRWWLADRRQVPGKLSFSPTGGISLELIGTLDPLQPGEVRPGDHGAIWGQTSAGVEATLFGCLETHSSLHFPGEKTSTYTCSWMIIGEHVDSADSAKFQELELRIFNLEEWAGLNGIVYQSGAHVPPDMTSSYGQGARPSPGILSYTQLPPLAFAQGEFQVSVECNGTWHSDSRPPSVGITQKTTFKIRGAREEPLERYLDEPVRSIRCLIELSTGSRVPLVSILAMSSRRSQTLPNGKSEPVPVSIILSQKRAVPVPERRHPAQMLFTLASLGPELSPRMRKWYEGREKFPATLDFHFSIDPERDSDIPLEFQFFSAFVACEAYHRATHDNEELEPGEYSRRRRLLLSSVEADPVLMRWANEKILGNEPSTRRRLEQLFDEQPEIVRRLIESKDTFVRRAVATRNKGVVHPHGGHADVWTGQSLFRATLALRLIIQTCLLREFGFTEPEIAAMVPKIREYRILKDSGGVGAA